VRAVDLHLEYPYEAPADVVWAMFVDRDFIMAKLEATGALEFDVEDCTSTPDGGYCIVTQRTVQAEVPSLPWDAVIDASNGPALPALALDLVEPGKRIVYVGLSGTPSLIDTRLLALKDVTAVGILAASQGLAGTIEHYARGDVDPRPLVAATVGLDRAGDVLAGWRPDDAGPGPKLHIDPRI
jgi:threonine dehydrogenase-like Zn-dependent dehydrogenase